MKYILRRSLTLVLGMLSLVLIAVVINSCGAYDHKHTIVISEQIEPKCFESGYTAGEYCSTCSEYKLGREEIPALGYHTPKEVDEIPATCGAYGLSAGVECSVCGEKLEGRELMSPTGRHQCRPPEWIWDGNFKSVAAVFECVICHTTATVRLQNGVANSGGTIDAKHYSDGSILYTAAVKFAGTTYSDEKMFYPENYVHKHEIDVIDGVAPSCTKTGLTAIEYCTTCDDYRVGGEEIPALGHTLQEVEGLPATCVSPGVSAGSICSVCKIVLEGEEIPPLGHTRKELEGVPATCVLPGITAGVICSVCNEVLEGRVDIPATGVHQCGEPEWIWSSDYETVEAVLECVYCGVTEAVGSKYITVVKEERQDGAVIYTASFAVGEVTYSDTKEVFPEN